MIKNMKHTTVKLIMISFGLTLVSTFGAFTAFADESTAELSDAAAYVVLSQKGDVNGDGKITTADVGIVNAHVRGIKPLDDYQTLAADVTGDGKVSTADVGKINAYVRKTAAVTKPSDIKINEISKTVNSVTLTWDKTDCSGYEVYYLLNGGEWQKAQTINSKDVNSCTVGGLSPSTTYSFKAIAFNKDTEGNFYYGNGDIREITTDTPAAPPSTPKISDTFYCETQSITLCWNSIQNADGYFLYRRNGNDWVKTATLSGADITSYKDKPLEPNTSYEYKVQAFSYNGSEVLSSDMSSSKKLSTKSTDTLYYTKKSANVYSAKYQYISSLSAGGFYTGYYDPHYPDCYVINYKSNEYLVKKSDVSVQQNAKVLKTGAVGQYGGSIAGYAACGPTSAAILVNSQLGASWDKDDLIIYSENHSLNDQGSLRSGGGMTAPNLIRLINQYSVGAYTAKNIYNSNPTDILKKQIDGGNRSIVVVQYTSTIVTHYNSGTHFVVICGYEYINGSLYFYYADPYYGNGPRSLYRVSASDLEKSMSMVVREPRCIITVGIS